MASLNRRFALAAIALAFLLLVMPKIASATTITVDTLSPTSVSGTITLGSTLPAIPEANSSLTLDGTGQSINCGRRGHVSNSQRELLYLSVSRGRAALNAFHGNSAFN